jgi:hypothetical protein
VTFHEERPGVIERPHRRRAVAWVGACIGIAVLAAGGAWKMGLTDSIFGGHAPTKAPSSALPATQLAELAPSPAATPPSPDPAPPAAPAAPAAGNTTAVVAAPAAVAPAHAAEEPPAPSPTAPAAPAPTARPVAAAAQPEAAPAAVARGKEIAHHVTPLPPPPRHVMPVDAPPPASPSHEVVEQALERIEPAFKTCLKEAATRVSQTPPSRIQVSLTIDEAGLARDLDSSAGRLPGLMDCVRDRSGRMRRGEAPIELGAVRVSFTISLPGPSDEAAPSGGSN